MARGGFHVIDFICHSLLSPISFPFLSSVSILFEFAVSRLVPYDRCDVTSTSSLVSHLKQNPQNPNKTPNTHRNHGQIDAMGLRHRLYLSKMALSRSLRHPMRFSIHIDSPLRTPCPGFHNDIALPPLKNTVRSPLCPIQCTRTCQSIHGHHDRSRGSADGSSTDTCQSCVGI